MLGKILGIDENQVLLKINLDLEKYPSLIGNHVIMEDTQRRCVGEITDIKEGIAYINLLGEIKNNKFVYGVITKPSFGAVTKVISKERIPLIISADNYEEDKHLTLGKSAIYEDVDINVDINNFFANHFAIFGSTGSGKSCSVARIFQNLFEKDNSIPYKASIFIFDAYGEYHQAFNKLHDEDFSKNEVCCPECNTIFHKHGHCNLIFSTKWNNQICISFCWFNELLMHRFYSSLVLSNYGV